MRNADLAAEGRAAPTHPDDEQRKEDPTMWENPSLQRELANLIITERVRRARKPRRR